MLKYLIALIVIIVAAALVVEFSHKSTKPTAAPAQNNTNTTNTSQNSTSVTSTPPSTTVAQAQLSAPINDAKNRITKKFFGTKVSPGNSPISPERFSGYHTGVDFETTPAEQNVDVPIYAACAGQLLMKKWASGYGGVTVQSCKLDGQDVTIIYGHLRLSSITPVQGAVLKAGQQIAVLGTGYSTETDGERKHLHFGIHKGKSINILGYVSDPTQLSNWFDAQKYL